MLKATRRRFQRPHMPLSLCEACPSDTPYHFNTVQSVEPGSWGWHVSQFYSSVQWTEVHGTDCCRCRRYLLVVFACTNQ